MTSAIMQPTFIPWIGYFDMIDKVDHFIFLDHVQLTKRSWQVRNRIKTSQGEKFITIPILKNKSRNDLFIKDALISYNDNWDKTFLKTLEQYYKKSTHYKEVFEWIEKIMHQRTQTLGALNINIIKDISKRIGITTNMYKSSDLHSTNVKDEMLVELIKEIGCDKYLSAQGSSVYIELNSPGGSFTKNKIELYYHNYEHPNYEQGKNSFLPYMAIIDLLMNIGFDNALNVIKQGRKQDIHYKKYRKKMNL